MEAKRDLDLNVFQKGLEKWNIELSDTQYDQFMDYFELLVEKNKVMNLTAITKWEEVVTKHFLDSLSLINLVNISTERLIDVGTGAGFPGIPLKIVYPDTEIVLLDSLKKRLIFLDDVIEKLSLKKITTIHGRAEDFGRDKEYREGFDLCVSRAVARLSSLSEYCLPFVKKGGYFIPYKSGKVKEELDESKRAFKLLGAELEKNEIFLLPDTDMERTLLLIKKINTTPGSYPRTSGKPSKDPL
ncbi:MAG: 16S rRNA (guanine(527)-N(7))-methyltransferase RsmG [Mobilitalea sp.]